MQCVILAAGNGKRLLPLTHDKPKPLVLVCGKPILDHVVESLPEEVDEIILVIGYKGEMIQEYCGEEFHSKKVRYVVQEKQEGTASALWLCKDLLKGRFMMLFADDIHGKKDLAELTKQDRGILVMTHDDPSRFGVVIPDENGMLDKIVEKPDIPPTNIVTTGPLLLDDKIFNLKPEKAVKGEYYLPEVIERYSVDNPIKIVKQKLWIPIGYPEDIESAEKILCLR